MTIKQDNPQTTAIEPRVTPWDGLHQCQCGGTPAFMDVRSLAFIVRCQNCGRQTGLERCAIDAANSWQEMGQSA